MATLLFAGSSRRGIRRLPAFGAQWTIPSYKFMTEVAIRTDLGWFPVRSKKAGTRADDDIQTCRGRMSNRIGATTRSGKVQSMHASDI